MTLLLSLFVSAFIIIVNILSSYYHFYLLDNYTKQNCSVFGSLIPAHIKSSKYCGLTLQFMGCVKLNPVTAQTE